LQLCKPFAGDRWIAAHRPLVAGTPCPCRPAGCRRPSRISTTPWGSSNRGGRFRGRALGMFRPTACAGWRSDEVGW